MRLGMDCVLVYFQKAIYRLLNYDIILRLLEGHARIYQPVNTYHEAPDVSRELPTTNLILSIA